MARPILQADALASAREVFEKKSDFKPIADALGVEIAFDLGSKHLANLERLYVSEAPSSEATREALTVAVCEAPRALREFVWQSGWGNSETIANQDQCDRIVRSGRTFLWTPPK